MKKLLLALLAVTTILIAFMLVIPHLQNKNLDNRDKIILNDTSKIAEKMIQVPAICQYPALPTGCESTAAAMVLQYYNDKITPEDFANGWLACSENFYTIQNQKYGPDPNEVFAGNPFSESSSYGCYAAPIVAAINENSTQCKAQKITGQSLQELCRNYIDHDKPILIWATVGMKESSQGNSWFLEDGSQFTWIAGEHCLVLVGYNKDYYFFNDPQSGSTVAYQKEIAQKRFAELNSQAVYIFKDV